MAYIGTTRDTCQIQGLGVITPGTYEAEKAKEAAKGAAKEGQVGPERATGSHREPQRAKEDRDGRIGSGWEGERLGSGNLQ